MTRLPLVPFRDLAKIAESLDFVRMRQKGSHVVFRRFDGRTTVIPDHGSADIDRPLLRSILRDLGLSINDYVRLLGEL